MSGHDLAASARQIIDANLYMVLGTADSSGRPWVTPVYFASDEYRDFFWVSSPESTHSRNIRERAEIAIVVFDSSVAIGTGQGVYMPATARELGADPSALEVYSRRSLAHGGIEWTAENVVPPARHRMYQATATEHFVLDERDRRVRVEL